MEYSIKPWFKAWWGRLVIALLTLVLILAVAIGFYIYNNIKAAKLELKQTGIKLGGEQYKAAEGDHYWLGSDKAKITIVEFGDFACPVCEKAFPTTGALRLNYKNDIKFIWRDYPVVAEYSALLALGGRCAGEQGLFWPMHDKLFQNQSVSTTGQLSAIANQVGADTVRFNDCLTKQKYLPQIQKDLSDGQTFGITGTPTYFINGYKIAGDIPLDTFIKIIEGLKK